MSNQPSIIATQENEIYRKAVAEFKSKQSKDPKAGPDYPAILIVGPSGSGKSNSLRNLPPEETGIINVESKVLPFNAAAFEENHLSNFEFYRPVHDAIIMFKADPRIKYIVIDSFTKYGELLYNVCRTSKQGWDIQNMNNDTLFEFLQLIKSVKNKFVIITGIDEIVADSTVTGATVRNRRLAVSGKKWEGKVEKEFTLVLFTEVKPIQGKQGEFEYVFNTNTDGTTSAKSPAGMFPRIIPNDIKAVCDKCVSHFGLK